MRIFIIILTFIFHINFASAQSYSEGLRLYKQKQYLEAAEIFKTEGIIYDKNYLNAVENVNNYITNTQKALNFGVYGVDLSYATIFDQTQACMLYINCSKKLAEELGLTNVFDVASWIVRL